MMSTLFFRYAASVGARHFLTSAKLNQNIEEVFLELSQRMIERADVQEAQKVSKLGRNGSMRRNVIVVDDEVAEAVPTRQGCCGGTPAT